MTSSVYDRESTLQLIGMVEDVPSLPDRYAAIQEVLDDPNSSAAQLAEVIGTDQATTAMILKFANSPFYLPTNQRITTLPQAIARMGAKEAGQIALTMSLLYGFAIPGGMGAIRAFWAHAFAVALLAKHMARLLGLNADELFVSGLLHDIGRAILGIRVDMGYFEGPLARLTGNALVSAERETYGVDHAEAGDAILKLWNIPEVVRAPIAAHHAPQPESMSARVLQLADAEAHLRLPHAADIESVPQYLLERPDRVREILVNEGLLPEEDESSED